MGIRRPLELLDARLLTLDALKCAEQMGVSRLEVTRLENVIKELASERTQLQQTVATLSERSSCLDSELKDVLSHELQLKEEAEATGAKILALEECISDSENKVSKKL